MSVAWEDAVGDPAAAEMLLKEDAVVGVCPNPCADQKSQGWVRGFRM